jgi:hypothetical protein
MHILNGYHELAENTLGEYTHYLLGMYEPGPDELATCAQFSGQHFDM